MIEKASWFFPCRKDNFALNNWAEIIYLFLFNKDKILAACFKISGKAPSDILTSKE